MLTAVNPFNVFDYGLTGVFLFLDGIVYWVVSKLFALYEALAGARIIRDEAFQNIASKIYVIIGVVMLFYLAYALLKNLINPDEFGKNTSKLAINLIISLILMGVTPTIFSYAFNLQEIIMKEDIVGKLVLANGDYSVSQKGNKAAFNTLNAFVNPEPSQEIIGDTGLMWSEFKLELQDGTSSFLDITDFVEPLHNHDAEYIPIVSTLCGVFLAYVLISFCFDLGIRVVKLAFYQMISPIPILMRIIPEKKSVFDNFVKGSIATYLEVFIRLFIMYLVVYLTSEIFGGDVLLNDNNLGVIGYVFVAMGLFAFAKQAPKLISDVIGVDSGNIKLGIGGKLAAGGAFGVGAIAGGAATSILRNATNKWANGANWLNKNGKVTAGSILKNAFAGVGSMAAGGLSAGARSAKGGFTAKNFADMRKAAGEGTASAEAARDKRANYIASHGGVGNAMWGHVEDAVKSAGEWSGISTGLKGLKEDQTKANEVKNARKAVDDKLMALLNKYKDTMTTAGGAINAGFTDASGRAVTFDNYATLLNEMEIMKSTGKMSDGVTVATSQMLTDMSNAEYQLKEQMKKEILEGYDLRNKAGLGVNSKLSGDDFVQFYDSELQSLVTDYRTKALQNAKLIDSYADKSIATIATEMGEYTKQAITNQNQELSDFISSGNVLGLFEGSKNAISNATGNVDRKVSEKYQEESQKKGS